MKKSEFTGQFDRLCRGLEYSATQDQAEAIFRRVGHVALSVWAESVTTLLCDGRKGFLPKLEHVLAVLDAEADSQRRIAVEQGKYQAHKTYTLLHEPVNPDEQSRIPTPGTPLFACIKAFAGREDVLRRLARIKSETEWTDGRTQRERERLAPFLAQYERDIEAFSPLLHDADAARLVQQYETPLNGGEE